MCARGRGTFALMRALIKKIHMYIGLLSFSNLIVFGIAGLAATSEGGPRREAFTEPPHYESFPAPADATDRQIAEQVFARYRFPFADPVPGWALHRDEAGNLPLEFWTVSEVHRVTYLPKEGRVRIERHRKSLPIFLDDMHTVTGVEQSDWRMRAWAWYNRFAMWSLLAMAISGVYLWLASRPGYRMAQYLFVGGGAIFVVLYLVSR